MVNSKDETTSDKIDNLQQSNRKTNLKICTNISNYYDEMKTTRQTETFEFEKNPLPKSAELISKNIHEVLLLLKLSQTKPQIKSMNIVYYDLYYTVFKNRDDKEIVNDKSENNELDYNKYNDFIAPNHYIGRKNDDVTLRQEK